MLSIKQAYTGILETALIQEIVENAYIKTFNADDLIIDTNQYIKAMPLLLDGAIKIVREDDTKGELLLYYLGKG